MVYKMKKGKTHPAAATNDNAFNSLIPPISAARAWERLILPKLTSIAPKAMSVPVIADINERQGIRLVEVVAEMSGEQVKQREHMRSATAVIVRTEPRTRVKSASMTNRLVFKMKKRAKGRSANSRRVALLFPSCGSKEEMSTNFERRFRIWATTAASIADTTLLTATPYISGSLLSIKLCTPPAWLHCLLS